MNSKVEAVHSIVHPALAAFCSEHGFLLTYRKKELPSLYEKLFTARYETINQVDDILAYSVVVDLSSQTDSVEYYLKRAFCVQTVRGPQTLFDERFFDFDCTRVVSRLGHTGADKEILNSVLFEVQIKTLLQYAWSKITHPIVYKPETYDAQKSRLAAETLARLEAVDRTFQNFDKIAPTVKTVRRKDMVGAQSISNMIESLFVDGTIPSELKPRSGRRVSECIFASLRRDKRHEIERIVPQLRSFIVDLKPVPVSVSVFELCVVYLFRNHLLDLGSNRKPRYYYVSDELRSIFPEVTKLRQTVRLEPEF